MLPYQMSRALADLRIRDLLADATRHELATAARRGHRNLAEPSAHLSGLTHRKGLTALLSLLQVRQGTRASSTMTSASGPMGCSA